MKPMKRLIDGKPVSRLILQSLPIALAAIVFVIYGATFLPASTERMERSVALVEGISHYELRLGGKPVMAFKSFNDSLQPQGLALSADSTVTTRRYLCASWVNKYPFIASCGGLLLIANDDSVAERRVLQANGRLPYILKATADRLAVKIRLLERQSEEIDYYMKVHNVNDDGYNVMAEYSARVKAQRDRTVKMLSHLNALSADKRLEVKLVTEYALLTPDTAGRMSRKTCNIVTSRHTSPFRLLQTVDRSMPDGARAVYLHQWLLPSPEAGDSVVIAAEPGCTAYKYDPTKGSPATFGGAVESAGRHDVPPLLAPDGALVFTSGGRLAGINVDGRIVKPSVFGFGLKELLK